MKILVSGVFLLILALTAIACAPAAPTATPDIPATVTARMAAIPTATPYPTFTPYPTATAYPTYTPYPTPTPTPRPTATPRPTPTPIPTVKWGLPYKPVSIVDATSGTRINTEPFILHGCYATSEDDDSTSGFFTKDGNLQESNRIVRVIGFAQDTFLSSSGCYNMAVQFQRNREYCYSYVPAWQSCPGFERNTPVFRLIKPDSFERR